MLLLVESSAPVSFGLFAFMTWDVAHQLPFRFRPGRRVDVYVPTYNEDVSILETTLVGCKAITYPHTTYVLDDGGRPEIEELATRLDCIYLTRPDNKHAKAGNLNAALSRTQVFLFAQPDVVESTRSFRCDPDSVAFRSWVDSSGAPERANTNIAQHVFGGATPHAGGEQVHLNLWLDAGRAPGDDQSVEVVVRNFKFTP